MDKLLSRLTSLAAVAVGAAFAISAAHVMGLMLGLPVKGVVSFLDISDIINSSPLLSATLVTSCVALLPLALIGFGPTPYKLLLLGTNQEAGVHPPSLLRAVIVGLILLVLMSLFLYLVRLPWQTILGVAIISITGTAALMALDTIELSAEQRLTAASSILFVIVLAASGMLGFSDGMMAANCPVRVDLVDKVVISGDAYLGLDRGIAVFGPDRSHLTFVNWASVRDIVRMTCH